jgi:hypothetical protein
VPLTNLDREAEIKALAARLDLETAGRYLKQMENTLAALDANVNTRLALEVLLMDLPRSA